MYTYDRRRFAMEFPTDEALKKYLKSLESELLEAAEAAGLAWKDKMTLT